MDTTSGDLVNGRDHGRQFKACFLSGAPEGNVDNWPESLAAPDPWPSSERARRRLQTGRSRAHIDAAHGLGLTADQNAGVSHGR